ERAVHAGAHHRAAGGDDRRGARGERHAASAPPGGVTSDALRALLRVERTVAVVGLSPKPERPSHGVARYLQRVGYALVPVNPGHDEILGERSYRTLADAARDHAIALVDVFRRSELAGAVVNEASPMPPTLV